MTTQDEIKKLSDERDTLQKTLEDLYAEAPAEAGFSMNFQMAHPIVGNTQVTFRGARAGDGLRVIEQVRTFAATVQKNGWKFNVPAPVPEKVAQAKPENGSKAVSGQDVPAAPDGKDWLTVDIQQIKVLPQPDNKVKVEFWNPGRKYPEETVNGTNERGAGILKHVTDKDIRQPQNLSLPCRVYYILGKEKTNKPGEFWHDVYHVRLIQ